MPTHVLLVPPLVSYTWLLSEEFFLTDPVTLENFLLLSPNIDAAEPLNLVSLLSQDAALLELVKY